MLALAFVYPHLGHKAAAQELTTATASLLCWNSVAFPRLKRHWHRPNETKTAQTETGPQSTDHPHTADWIQFSWTQLWKEAQRANRLPVDADSSPTHPNYNPQQNMSHERDFLHVWRRRGKCNLCPHISSLQSKRRRWSGICTQHTKARSIQWNGTVPKNYNAPTKSENATLHNDANADFHFSLATWDHCMWLLMYRSVLKQHNPPHVRFIQHQWTFPFNASFNSLSHEKPRRRQTPPSIRLEEDDVG